MYNHLFTLFLANRQVTSQQALRDEISLNTESNSDFS